MAVTSFSQTLDQSWAPASPGGGTFSASPTQDVGQSFIAGVTGDLSQINLRLINSTLSPSTTFVPGDFQVRIFNGNGYGGSVLNTTVVNITSVSTSYQEQIVTLSSVVPIIQGNSYTIDFRGLTGTVGIHGADSGYANGGLYFSNGSTGLYNSYDLWFKTFVTLSTPATHLNFDGVNDRVELSNESNFDFTSTFSMEAWIRVTSFTVDWQTVISKGEQGPRIHRYSNTNFIAFGTGLGDDLASTVSVNDGNWHHIAATCNNGFKSLYVDGVLQGTQTVGTPLVTNNDNVRIGSQIDSYSPIRAFHGDIDEVRFWNVARTAEQISGSRNCELQGSETGLVSYYKFNQGIDASDNSTIISLTDATAFANNGTLINFTKTGAVSNFLAGSPVTTGSIVPSVATVTTPVTYNQGATATALTATTGANGTGLVWYTTATGGTGTTTAPTPSTATAGSTSYWVSSTNANGCESARTEIVVTVLIPATHLNFDGANDRINCGNSTSVQITGSSITLEAWVKLSSFAGSPSDGNIINKEQNSPDYGYMLRVGGSGIVNFNLGNGSWNELNTSANSVQLGTWHHIAGTYDGTNMKIYIDGSLVATQPRSIVISNSTANLFIGDWPNTGRNINGSIDEVRIWNRALPIAEIQNNMNCELPSPSTQNGLVAYYQFNQGVNEATNTSVTSLTDTSGNANNGTLTNFALTGTTSNWLAGSPIVTGTNCAVLSTSNFEIANNIKMYPNPTSNFVTVEVNNLTNAKLQVLDITGKTLMNQALNTSSNNVDVQHLPSGMYLFKVSSNEGTSTGKIIKN